MKSTRQSQKKYKSQKKQTFFYHDIIRAANPKWKQRGVFLRIFEKKEEFAKNKRSFVILTGRMTIPK